MDEEKKQNKRDWGATLANIVRTIKALKNPIIFWLAVAIIVIFILIGFVGFFQALPGNVLGKLGESITSWVTNLFVDTRFEIKQSDLIDICKYLEDMGYDLEGYGFVEEITREGEKTYQDQNFQNPKQPDRGEITSVKSKYLEAYLIAERKSYAIANDDWKPYDIFSIFNTTYTDFYAEQAVEDAFNDVWPIDGNERGYFQEILDNFYERKDGSYVKKSDKQPADDNTEIYRYYANVPEGDIRHRVKEAIKTYYKYKKTFAINLDFNIELSLRGEEKTKFLFGKNLLNAMSSNNRYAFENVVDSFFESNSADFSEYENYGTGMIILEDNTNKPDNGSNVKWVKDNIEYQVTIDEKNRYFIVETFNGDDFWRYVKGGSSYAYDLNGWTCKYGKPIEALLAMHLGTCAPDFVYLFATSPAVDTKVHIDLFPVQMHLKFVMSEESGEYIRPIIEKAIEDEVNSIVTSTTYSNLINSLRAKKNNFIISPIDNIIATLEKYIDEDITVDGEVSLLEELYSDLNSIYNKLNPNSSAGMAFSNERKYVNNIREMINNSEITILDTTFSYREKEIQELYATAVKYEDSIVSTATPYITKVVNHWYRNQYFLGDDEISISTKKTELAQMLTNINELFTEYDELSTEVTYLEEDAIEKAKDEIEGLETEDEIDNFISSQMNNWLGKATTEEQKEKLENIFNVATNSDQVVGEDSSYDIIANPDPAYYQLPAEAAISENETVNEFFRKIYVEETRSADIIQIHNPIFEDNSQYIRNWLKDKYYIFNGTTDDEKAQTTGETTSQTLNEKKVAGGKQYIQGKTALQVIDNLLEKSTDRQNIIYLRRDLKELFEDFEFDLENVEIPTQKILDNVMPDYIPYTPWPSVYEEAESDCTKMIYKANSANLVAPASGTITKASNGTIEIEFESNDEQTISIAGMTLNIKGNVKPSVGVGTTVKRGQVIGTASQEDNIITIELRLFSVSKQLLNIQNYMNVEHKTYDGEGKYRLSDDEKIMLYNLQNSEIDMVKQEAYTQCQAIVNVVFNKIASPYYSSLKSVASVLVDSERDFLKYSTTNTNLYSLEGNSIAKSAIINALNGVDITKTNTLLGATRYFATDDEYYTGIEDVKEEKLKELEEEIKVKMEITNRAYGITEEEYLEYLGDILMKKIDEVIYTLNYDKYVEGYEEYSQFVEQFGPAKEEVLNYYKNGNYIESSDRKTSQDVITSIVKSNVEQEIEEKDGTITVTDKFTITANSNYMANWKFTYTKGPEGRINSSILVEYEVIKNF